MFGTTLTCSALAGLLQFPLFLLVQNYLARDPLWVNVGFMILILFSFGLPVYVIYYCKAVKRRILAGLLRHISIQGKPEAEAASVFGAATENAGFYYAHGGGGGGGGGGGRAGEEEKMFIAEYLSSV